MFFADCRYQSDANDASEQQVNKIMGHVPADAHGGLSNLGARFACNVFCAA